MRASGEIRPESRGASERQRHVRGISGGTHDGIPERGLGGYAALWQSSPAAGLADIAVWRSQLGAGNRGNALVEETDLERAAIETVQLSSFV